jgi:hypothetical protein
MEEEQLNLNFETPVEKEIPKEIPVIPYSELVTPKDTESKKEYMARISKAFKDNNEGLVVLGQPTAEDLEVERINKITKSFFGNTD